MRIAGTLAQQLKVTPDVLAHRGADWKFGIGELIFLSFNPPLQGAEAQGRWSWKSGRAGELQEHAGFPGEALYICPSTAQHVALQYVVPRPPNARPGPPSYVSLEFDVIAPKFNLVKYQDLHDAIPQPNAGFMAAFILTPDSVSFARVALRECGGSNAWTAGFDNEPSINASMHILGKKHTSNYPEHWSFDFNRINRPAGSYARYIPQKAVSIGKVCPGFETIRKVEGVSGTVMFVDKVYNSVSAPFAWVGSDAANAGLVLIEYYLDIPVHYTVLALDGHDPGAGIGTPLVVNRHILRLFRDGTVTVSKGPCSHTTHRAPAAAAPAAAGP